ncbi:MAG TPA: prepilin-type N-terminal cleavage/methylation domain-containing protein [Pyrinomonadaceae bacterium]|jgi:prepilin-type N-terminal cleavage/methylation domain-containing protein
MKKKIDKAAGRRGEAGFSLIELMVALGVTLVIMAVASRMLAMTMAVRQRENQRSEAIADTQRALQAMTREISNAGLGMSNNGLVDADSGDLAIRVRTNLNAFCGTTEAACDEDTDDAGEDVVFVVLNNTTGGGGDNQRLITRQDRNSDNSVSALANRVDDLGFTYVKADGTTTATASEARSVKITVAVTLPPVGSEGQPGYQPASRTQLTSEAVLRNLLLEQ